MSGEGGMTPDPQTAETHGGGTAGHPMTRSHARESLIAGLLAGRTLTEAAELAGISRRTAQRIRKTDEFESTFQQARSELLSGAIAALHNHAADFVATLHTMATDPEARGSDRVLAARHGLDLLLRGVETLEVNERLERLENLSSNEA